MRLFFSGTQNGRVFRFPFGGLKAQSLANELQKGTPTNHWGVVSFQARN